MFLIFSHTLKQHFKGKKYECPCGSVFKSKQALKKHKIIHKDDKSEKYAEKAPTADPMLELARKGNEGVKFEDPHTCCFCKKVFSTRKTLKTHLIGVHKKAPPLCCDLCSKFYNYKILLEKHMKIHCEKPFTCNICDFKTVHKAELKSHKMTHEPKYQCNICNKKVSSIREHMRSHVLKERCPICSKMVKYPKDHKKFHDEKRFKCNRCEEFFERYENLRM